MVDDCESFDSIVKRIEAKFPDYKFMPNDKFWNSEWCLEIVEIPDHYFIFVDKQYKQPHQRYLTIQTCACCMGYRSVISYDPMTGTIHFYDNGCCWWSDKGSDYESDSDDIKEPC